MAPNKIKARDRLTPEQIHQLPKQEQAAIVRAEAKRERRRLRNQADASVPKA
jgi:regulator of protease activity HflC (stomatin/prohibitin superfamily)